MRILLALCMALCAAFTTSVVNAAPTPQHHRGGGDGGIVNLPGGWNMVIMTATGPYWLVVPYEATDPKGPDTIQLLLATGGGELPKLKTTYTDRDGQEHTIETPIVSVTPTGIQKAINQHAQTVAAFKQVFPPVDPTP